MLKVLLVGALCFAAGFVAASKVPEIQADLERYNKLRSMSGEEPLMGGNQLEGIMSMASRFLGGGDSKDGAFGILKMVPGLESDVDRYVKLRSM